MMNLIHFLVHVSFVRAVLKVFSFLWSNSLFPITKCLINRLFIKTHEATLIWQTF